MAVIGFDHQEDGFRRTEDCHTVELECTTCHEQLVFTSSTTLGEIEREMLNHKCTPTALLPRHDAFGRPWGDSRSYEDCHSDADPGL